MTVTIVPYGYFQIYKFTNLQIAPNMLSQSDLQNIKQRFGIIGNSPLLNHGIEIAL